MVISTKIVVKYINKSKLYLFIFSILGAISGLIYSSNAAKIYEATAILNLPYINQEIESSPNEKKTIIIPSPNELRQFLMNPLNITNEMLEICNLSNTNKNKLKLVSSIYLVSFDKNDKSILLQVRSVGIDNAKLCAGGLIKIISIYSDDLKNKYIESMNLNENKLLNNINSKASDKLIVSDSYVYPRTRLNILFGMLVGLNIAIVLSLIKFLKISKKL